MLYYVLNLVLQNTSTVKSLYKTICYNTDLDITWSHSVIAHNFFYHEILQRSYRKMTMKWSFSYKSFVKLSLYNMIHL